MKKVKAGIIGCGMISDIYLQSLTGQFQILETVACADRHLNRAKKKAEKYGIRALSIQEMLEDPEITMILNLTSPAGHYEITRQALEHDKHVYSEKMMALELEEGKELCQMADQRGKRLGVAPDTFLGGSIQTARYIVDRGLIGQPLSVVVSLNRNFTVFGDILPFLHKKGGNIPYDVGCYYMTALAYILGPAERISSFSRKYKPERISLRADRPWYGEKIHVEGDNILTSTIQYQNGVLGTIHLNGESIQNENQHLEIYGTDGILIMGNPNNFDSPVYIRKPMHEAIEFPFTHGFTRNVRGLGAAEMAWAMDQNRPHRASKEMAYHVFEIMHGMEISAHEERIYKMQSSFERPAALPEGYLPNGAWGSCEESALIY